ncbi:hypothetical protein RRF57_008033 [Xylaria bambusicola]|uniref:Uncharacterized protein n=1 Tax=Xylaria bambusicola TaxID=326684 RepID=A0AAN7UH27_9PEZI
MVTEDVDTLAIVGEVGTAVIQSGRTNSDSLLGSCRRVVASIRVVVAGGDSKVQTSSDGRVNSLIQRGRLTTAERHVSG